MSQPTNYCTLEYTFLTGGENHTFMTLTSAQRYAYICAWSYATSLRKIHLSYYEIEHRLGAIYDIDRRTVAKMLQRCSKDAELLIEEDGGYTIVGVADKHSKLKGFKPSKSPSDTEPAEDSIGYNRIGEDTEEAKPTPKPTVKEHKKPKLPYGQKFEQAWQDWVQYRIEKRKKLTPLSVTRQLKKLSEYKSELIAVNVLEQSILNGWIGLFDPKGESPKPTTHSFVLDGRPDPDPDYTVNTGMAKAERARELIEEATNGSNQ